MKTIIKVFYRKWLPNLNNNTEIYIHIYDNKNKIIVLFPYGSSQSISGFECSVLRQNNYSYRLSQSVPPPRTQPDTCKTPDLYTTSYSSISKPQYKYGNYSSFCTFFSGEETFIYSMYIIINRICGLIYGCLKSAWWVKGNLLSQCNLRKKKTKPVLHLCYWQLTLYLFNYLYH